MTRGDPDHLSIVIHEIRNPIVGIEAAARVLASQLGSHPGAKGANAIAAGSRELLDLLETVTEAEAADAGRLRSILEPADLALCVREAVAQTHVGSHRVALTGADRPVMVRADAGRVGQVLRNLLRNAAQYSPSRSAIDVTLAVDTKQGIATVEVADRGAGIPAAERRRLFTKFSRLSTADGTRGSGLGLYISSAIVTDHHGRMSHRDRESGGSVFSFTIPLEGAKATVRSSVVGKGARPAARSSVVGKGARPARRRLRGSNDL